MGVGNKVISQQSHHGQDAQLIKNGSFTRIVPESNFTRRWAVGGVCVFLHYEIQVRKRYATITRLERWNFFYKNYKKVPLAVAPF